jgi:Kef-type K+ transport system membrane component KefB
MVVLTVIAYFGIRWIGETTLTTAAVVAEGVAEAKPIKPVDHTIYHVLLALMIILVAGRVFGKLLGLVGQPQVIGEVVAGIALGPSFLGWISPDTMNYVLPKQVLPFLGVIAQIGIILYMFLIGLELNGSLLRKRAHATIAISHASIIAPFLLGSVLSLGLYHELAPEGVSFTIFSLFMGVAMSITAFPVLARILTDHNIEKTPIGIMAISCAATDDVTAWCLLALLVGFAHTSVASAIAVMVFTVAYVLFMVIIARPFVARWAENRPQGADPNGFAIALGAMLLSSLFTEVIGIHAIFGAFLLGAIVPHESPIAKSLVSKLQDFVSILFLPAFFAYTGMRTSIGLVSTPWEWGVCIAIIAVATLGKFGATVLAARLLKVDWRSSSILGALMNTRGLMELVVLNIGLDLGVITPTLFAMMVIMALVTTFMTTPMLRMLWKEEPTPAMA